MQKKHVAVVAVQQTHVVIVVVVVLKTYVVVQGTLPVAADTYLSRAFG